MKSAESNYTLNRKIDYALGGRGVDRISTTTGGSTVVSYPLYDAHGNMISTLTKGAGGTYAYSALRGFDAWGKIRTGATTGDPTGRYCANLGHKQDDESDRIRIATSQEVSVQQLLDGFGWRVVETNSWSQVDLPRPFPPDLKN